MISIKERYGLLSASPWPSSAQDDPMMMANFPDFPAALFDVLPCGDFPVETTNDAQDVIISFCFIV